VFLILFLLLATLICQAGLTNTADAATYYLDAVNGDDSNPGTSNQPWQTITKVESDAEEGDTVIIRKDDAEVFRFIFDKDLTNYNSGISVLFGGEDGIDWAEEYFWHDKVEDDHKVVYIKADTPVYMMHNERNMRTATKDTTYVTSSNTARFILDIGVTGEDGIPDSGDEGVIRYRVDRDLQMGKYFWSKDVADRYISEPYPLYNGPFTLDELEYEPGTPVVGTTGGSHPDMTQDRKNSYYRGVLDEFGDEWHILAFADDDTWNGPQEWSASDGKTILFVVNPKTPSINFKSLTSDAQFYTTPAKAYWIPKVHNQTTYLTDNIEIILTNIMGGNIYYRFDSNPFQIYTGPISSNTLIDGEHTLEYYYDDAHHKIRKIVKNPAFPSAGEGHGYMLWKDDGELEAIKNRLKSDYPNTNYETEYNDLQVNTNSNGHGRVDNYYNTGRRIVSDKALVNAFIALVEGYTYTQPGETDSYATYAKKMLLDNIRKIDPLNYDEFGSSFASKPCMEINYRAYRDINIIFSSVFAYDILIKDFKSTHHAGGITSIEDYKIRDMLARFSLEVMMQLGNYHYLTKKANAEVGQTPRDLAALMAALAMPSYNTHYYGTSGFDGTSASYAYTPFPAYPVTWKEAFYTETNQLHSYPNQAHRYDEVIVDPLGIRDHFITENEIIRPDGITMPPGSFFTDIPYYGDYSCLYKVANVMKIKENYTYPFWEMAFDYANKGTLYGGPSGSPDRLLPRRFPQLLLINERFPDLAQDAEDNLDGTYGPEWNIWNQLYGVGVYGLIFYHDKWDTTPPTIPENLIATAVSENRIDLTWSESSDSQSGIDHYKIYRYRNSVVEAVFTSSASSYSDTDGLIPETIYTYRVSAINGHGVESGKSNPAQARTRVDITLPSIVSVEGLYNSLKIVFDGALDKASAETVANYSINNNISVTGASLEPDQVTVTLTTSAHSEGTYTLTVRNVKDAYGNAASEIQEQYLFAGNLVLYLNCDNNLIDQSNNNNNGTWNGLESYGPGILGSRGILLDGTADGSYVVVKHSDILDGMSQLSLSAWTKKNSDNVGGRILCKHVTYSLAVIGNTVQNYLVNSQGTLKNLQATSASINDTEWHHYAVTYDGATMKLFIDGQEADSESLSDDIAVQPSRDLLIGKEPAGNAFHGSIDDVRIYNRALDATEVLAIYNAGSNLPPELSPIGPKSVNEGVELTFTVTATDADGDAITYSIQNKPSGATLDPQTGKFSWTPSHDQTGNYPNVKFIASDGKAQDSEPITITVNNVNRPPVAVDDSATVAEDSGANAIDVLANDLDADGDTLTITAVTQPSHGSVVITGGGTGLTYTPAANYNGSDSFTYTVSDGNGGTNTATVTITVINVNRPPVLSAIGNKSVYADDLLTFTVNATDPDGETIIYSATNLPFGANFDPSTQTFTWTPSESQVGSHDDVRFIAADSEDQTVEPITITVSSDTLAPRVANPSPAVDSIQAPLNSLITLDVVDDGKGVDANSVTINVNDNIVYSGNTARPGSTTYGECHRIGTKAHYAFIYQSNEMFDFDQPINVTAKATDLAGNVMNEYSYSFKSEMRSFGENKILHSGSNNENWGPLTTVADSSGNIWVAWPQGVVGSRDIYIGKLTVGTDSFVSSGIVQVTNDSNDQGNPVLAVDGADKLYLAWQDNRQGEWDIYISTSDDWSTQTKITDPNSNQINPAIAVDSTDRVYVVWEDDQNSDKDIYIASSTNSFSTQVTTRITSAIYDQITPDIAVGYGDIADLFDDTVYVVWTDMRNSTIRNDGSLQERYDIYGAASNDGPWANIPIVTEDERQTEPAIATEADGSILHLVWLDDTPGDDDIYYATSDGLPASPLTGGSIIDPLDPGELGTDQISPVIITTGSTGDDLRVFACWRDERNKDADLYAVEIGAGAGTNVFVGDDGTNSDQSEPAIGIDGDGHPYLVWTNERTDICYAGSTFIDPDALASENVSMSLGAIVGTEPASISSIDDVSAEVPQGAYLCDIKVTISRIRNPHKPPSNNRTFLYEFGPSGTTFSEPVTITIPYNATTLVSSPSAYWYNPLTGLYSQEGITDVEVIQISSGLYALRFKTTHFSIFGGGGSFDDIFGGGGGGGGCSMSPNSQDSIAGLLLPYIGLAVAMVILKLRDRRKRKAHNITKSEC